MIFRFIYTLINIEGKTQYESTAFEADDANHAEELATAFVRLRLGMLYKADRITVEVGNDDRIYGATVGNKKLDGLIPVLAGEILLESDVQVELAKEKVEKKGESEGKSLKDAPDVPSV